MIDESLRTAALDSLLLEEMSREEQDVVLRGMRLRHFDAGEEILTEGDQTAALWLILRGECDVV